MSKSHKHAEIIKQWADGAEIECHYKSLNKWYVVNDPAWSGDFEFRVKPKIKWTPRYRRIAAYEDGICMNVAVPKAVCNYYIIQQFVEEYETDFDDQNYIIVKEDEGVYDYVLNRYESLGTIEMSLECARRICDMLNGGEIEL